MDKLLTKTRDIRFFSKKNNEIVCLHSKYARDFARFLEYDPFVQSYIPNYPLDTNLISQVPRVDIRQGYFLVSWATDFLVTYSDGHKEAKELVLKNNLEKRAIIEKLEFSRRYWSQTDADWKVVIIDG